MMPQDYFEFLGQKNLPNQASSRAAISEVMERQGRKLLQEGSYIVNSLDEKQLLSWPPHEYLESK